MLALRLKGVLKSNNGLVSKDTEGQNVRECLPVEFIPPEVGVEPKTGKEKKRKKLKKEGNSFLDKLEICL